MTIQKMRENAIKKPAPSGVVSHVQTSADAMYPNAAQSPESADLRAPNMKTA